MKRRDVLKRVGAASAGTGAAAAAMTGSAAAEHTDEGVDFPRDGAMAVTHHSDAPDIPGYAYLGSVYTDDLCELGTNVCVAGGVAANIAKFSWAGAWITGLMCAQTVGACSAKNAVRKVAGGDFVKWCYVYNNMNGGGPALAVVPRL